jgi:Zn-dependent membrane protease YugP
MLSSKHGCYATHNLASNTSSLLLLVRILVGTAMVVLRSGWLLLRSRMHEALSQLPHEFTCARRLVFSAAATTAMTATKELVCKAAEVAQWAGAMASTAATTMTRVLSAEQSVHSHALSTHVSESQQDKAGSFDLLRVLGLQRVHLYRESHRA